MAVQVGVAPEAPEVLIRRSVLHVQASAAPEAWIDFGRAEQGVWSGALVSTPKL